jgi:hypothetical protein
MAGPGIRGLVLDLAHRPLQAEWAQKLLYVLSVGFDANLEKLVQGVHDHMPTAAATPTALQYTGADRLVLRGLTETDASYAARQQRALDDWALAGNAWSVLAQARGYVLTSDPRALAVSSTWSNVGVCKSSQWDVLADAASLDSPPAHSLYDTGSVGNWDWDSASPSDGSWGWWRWYLVLDYADVAGAAWIGPSGKWGSAGKWAASGFAWGVDKPSLVGKSIKLIARQWKSQWCHWCVINLDPALFDSAAPAGGGVNPDGKFGRWSKVVGGVYVRARFSDARYFEGPL